MADQWYYERDQKKCGPVSARQLREFADAGLIQPADTIWKEGVETGVAAFRVKNLFPEIEDPGPAVVEADVSAEAPPPGAESPPPQDAAPSEPQSAEAAQQAATPTSSANPPPCPDAAQEATAPATAAATAEPEKAADKPAPPMHKAKKARAVALRGLAITAQDGSHVQFKKKCVVCGHEDPNKMRVPIKNGINRISYFCGKCKKMRQAEFQGVL